MRISTPLKWMVWIIFTIGNVPVGAVEAPPGHRGLTLSCETCHTTDSWIDLKDPIDYDHAQTGFPLDDQHRSVDCVSCHVKGDFVTVQRACQSCHEDVHRAENGNDCQRCHDAKSWSLDQPLEIHQMTRFPLLGVHATVDCESCHVNQTKDAYSGLPTDCYACHTQDYRQATSPNHMRAQFDFNCEQCHLVTTPAWKPSLFDHNETGFALVGAHVQTDCAICHVNGVFEGTATDCYTCHQLDYKNVTSPNHVRGQFDRDCLSCHTETVWTPSIFDHNETGFTLVGSHIQTDCASCHVNGVFEGTARDCYTCHNQDYETAQEPNHALANFDTNCQTCHTENAWAPSTFDHSETGFTLVGAHIQTDCASCHVNGVFEGTATDCYTCHQLDYENVRSPNHVRGQFDRDCLSCHTENAWVPSTFDHSETGFTLVGAHIQTDCASCHVNGVFEGTATDCYTCHQLDYENTQNPSHVLSQFSTVCLDCHTQTAWEPATFDHNQTNFPLTGQHFATSCTSCHTNGQYSNTPTDCYACHQSEFNTARDPNHLRARFPENCEACHNTSRWDPASFNHRPYFPIYTGEHRGEWDTCADCHTQPTDYKVFSCITCHEHSQARMDREHRGRRNYVYESNACYDCHPDGDD